MVLLAVGQFLSSWFWFCSLVLTRLCKRFQNTELAVLFAVEWEPAGSLGVPVTAADTLECISRRDPS